MLTGDGSCTCVTVYMGTQRRDEDVVQGVLGGRVEETFKLGLKGRIRDKRG